MCNCKTKKCLCKNSSLDAISNPEAAGFYPIAQVGINGKVIAYVSGEVLNRPPCELCGLPANINTQRLDDNIENKPYIDLCSSCDRKYQETMAARDTGTN